MKVINLFAGAGAGKSTTAAGLFFLMKTGQKSVELVTEFAKELVWEERKFTFGDQLYILAEQNHRLFRLKDKMDYAITDSPLLLSNIYCPWDFLPTFKPFAQSVFESYKNINFFLKRVKPYNPVGRNETYEGAMEKDRQIKQYLIDAHVPFIELNGDDKAPENIFKMLTYLPPNVLDEAANLQYR